VSFGGAPPPKTLRKPTLRCRRRFSGPGGSKRCARPRIHSARNGRRAPFARFTVIGVETLASSGEFGAWGGAGWIRDREKSGKLEMVIHQVAPRQRGVPPPTLWCVGAGVRRIRTDSGWTARAQPGPPGRAAGGR